MDPEYSVIGRVARRIWAVAMKNKYGANERSQKLKYHIQTSGRSLHAQEMDFNDIRTTLQALIAIYDNCNSLHTNAYDEAITTPTEESVRRAMAIQLIINREWGLAKNENPNQGAFIIDELTDLVEEAVLKEFEAISSAAACWAPWKPATSAARSRKSRCTTSTRSTTAPTRSSASTPSSTRRAWPSRKSSWPAPPRRKSRADQPPARLPGAQRRPAPAMLAKLKQTVIDNGNVFAVLVDAVRAARWARSPARCTKSAASTAAACKDSSAGEQQPGPERAEENDGEAKYLAVFIGAGCDTSIAYPTFEWVAPVFLRRYRCRGAKHRSSAVTGTVVTAISGSFVCATFDAE
jgi:hypothetical protein